MFIDELEIIVQAGNGGNGAISLHREKFKPRGGPDGGDGGRGGDVIFEANPSIKTLSNLAGEGRIFKAESGKDGGKNNCTGQDGRDLILDVPVGTDLIDSESGRTIIDLTSRGKRVIVAQGGRGGRGNAKFATSTNQAPRRAEAGKKTEPKGILLRFKLMADVGLIGYPNTGKSTLLARLTSAKPKIAGYSFTTIHPNLGVMEVDGSSRFILIDMPALIEGSHQGSGLGNRFLCHLGRTRLLVHLLDVSQGEVLSHFDLLNKELCLYDESLKGRPQLVALNKIDLIEDKERLRGIMDSLDSRGYGVILISALEGSGLGELKKRILSYNVSLSNKEKE